MITAMYLRKSRAEENQPVSDTLARHRDTLTAFARNEGLDVMHIYEEVASGDSLYKRPEMLRLIENLTLYQAVLCMDIDRLGRGAMHEQGLIFEAFRSAAVLIVTPSKTYDMSDDMDDSIISFKALFAREEYKMIRGRLRRGTIKAVEEGCYLSNAPYGYKQVRVNKKPTLEIVPEEADGVRLIFRMYCEGNGCQSIADTLHAIGLRPRRGNRFSRTTVAKIIRNPVYIGKVVWNQFTFSRPKTSEQKHVKRIKPRDEWMIVEGLHEAIIGRDIYEEANKRLSERYHPPYSKGGHVQNPFSGILYCSRCGMSMVRQAAKSKGHCRALLLCPTAGCMMSSALSVVEVIFYKAVALYLNSIAAQEEELPLSKGIDLTEAARVELARLAQQAGKLHDLLEQGVYDASTFLARRDELNGRIQQTQEIIDAAAQPVAKDESLQRLQSLLDEYWTGTPYERNRLYKSVVKRVVYTKAKGSGWGSEPTLEIVEWRY